MIKYLLNVKCGFTIAKHSSTNANKGINSTNQFERVFSLQTIKYFALINRLKVYHILGTGLCVPSCALMETFSMIPNYTFMTASYIGITGATVLSLATLPFHNVIGHLYISEDNKHIKISSVDFWGRRIDRIVSTEEWIPLLDMKPKIMDTIYLSPRLADGTKYKLLIKFGKVFNAQKMGQVLE